MARGRAPAVVGAQAEGDARYVAYKPMSHTIKRVQVTNLSVGAGVIIAFPSIKAALSYVRDASEQGDKLVECPEWVELHGTTSCVYDAVSHRCLAEGVIPEDLNALVDAASVAKAKPKVKRSAPVSPRRDVDEGSIADAIARRMADAIARRFAMTLLTPEDRLMLTDAARVNEKLNNLIATIKKDAAE